MTETLLCLTASHVRSLDLGEGFSLTDSSIFERLFDPAQIWLGPRSWLETDEGFRQLVSYVVFRHENTVLVVQRTAKGGEARLHGRLSIGIGGHVNVSDVVTGASGIDVAETLHRACTREISEEVACGEVARLRTVGVIVESANAVSRVHLGIVVECWLANPQVQLLDDGLVNARFVPIDSLALLASDMETWSSALVEHLERDALTGGVG